MIVIQEPGSSSCETFCPVKVVAMEKDQQVYTQMLLKMASIVKLGRIKYFITINVSTVSAPCWSICVPDVILLCAGYVIVCGWHKNNYVSSAEQKLFVSDFLVFFLFRHNLLLYVRWNFGVLSKLHRKSAAPLRDGA
jgi:hypothetical protein